MMPQNQADICLLGNLLGMSEDENLFHTYYSAVESVIEKASVQILASYLTSDTKWGLFNGFSSRPMMPIAAKMLFSKEVLKEDARLIQQLKVSKDDIRILKLYNMMAVT
ncbi:hypothetical protein LWE69_13900 [Paenibacillus sp. UKAQ_18]|nr:hypothetical protein [Paenibacillus sp. UKAQ_18]